MARGPRNDQVEMNFDGLTDSITNLVGNLILIVILMYGITGEVTEKGPPQVVELPQAARLPPPGVTGTKHVRDLLLELETLRAAVAEVDRDMAELTGQVPVLRRRAEAVLQKSN